MSKCKCVVCEGEGTLAERFARMEEKIEDDIMRSPHHCSLISVFSSDESPTIPFTYTVGLTDMDEWPELILPGLDAVIAGHILNNIIDECLECDQPPSVGDEFDKVANFPMRLREIDQQQILEYCCWSVDRQERMHGLKPRVLQVIYPDENGIWPDDPACDESTVALQQLLTEERRH